MLHLNEIKRRKGLESQLELFAHPQTYVARTIHDFLREKEEVQTTGFWSACLGGNPFLYDSTLIQFQNVRYWRVSEDTVHLQDITETLPASIIFPLAWNMIIESQGIVDGDKVQEAIVLYQKSKDKSYLYKIRKSIDKPKPAFVPGLFQNFRYAR
ncbi:hypothetical protein HYU08_00945 [Candidatus Woesearchaeota archaeon]|nr:hypothetical protein [Candidatus Woesearchaeota archaeon]